jgi:hypothetical protein
MYCFSIAGEDILLLRIGQLFCHYYVVPSTQHATIIITGKTPGLEPSLIAFLGRDLGGNGIDSA